ncbi:MAG: biotin/lipoyl-binding protein [Chthoniobacter sp.]
MKSLKRSLLVLAVLLTVAAGIYWQWHLASERLPGIASGNGRLEATEIDVATKLQGRIESVLVQEGDLVKEGQVLARIDAAVLRAQLRAAEAEKRRAEEDLNVARALIVQRESEYDLAQKILQRSDQLLRKTTIDQNQFDRDQSAERAAKAIWIAAQAQATSAGAAIDSAAAQIERIKADLDDTVLKSPCLGRVQYRLAEPAKCLPQVARSSRSSTSPTST